MSETHENYLSDLGKELLEMARDAQKQAQVSKDIFDKGRVMAYYEVLSLMKEEAKSFGLTDEALGLKNVNLEELMS